MIVLEVEVQNDERPLAAFVFSDDLLDDRAYLFEEIIFQGGFGAGGVRRVGDDDSALAGGWVDVPGEILFDGYRKAGVESALNAVVPVALVGVTVMRIQYGLVVVQEVQVWPLRQSGQDESRQKGDECDGFVTHAVFLFGCGLSYALTSSVWMRPVTSALPLRAIMSTSLRTPNSPGK